jgi:hypothetical protein
VITPAQYAASIVDQYRVVPDTRSGSHHAADDVMPLLKQWAQQYLQGITLSGAYAKNTAITLSSHVDILILLNPIPGMEIKKVFWSLFEFLTDRDVRAHTRNVSVRAARQGFEVDLIPAYRDHDGFSHSLFNKRTGATVHTDLGRHIHLVANSGRQQEICALKIWRERKSLDFPSLYLELTVLHALETERFGQLSENVFAVLRYLSSRFEQAVVRDPANPDNVLSNDLSAGDKKAIAKVAREAFCDENWKKILW